MKKEKLVTFRTDPILDESVRTLAKKHKVTVSEMYRRIINHYFSDGLFKFFKGGKA